MKRFLLSVALMIAILSGTPVLLNAIYGGKMPQAEAKSAALAATKADTADTASVSASHLTMLN